MRRSSHSSSPSVFVSVQSDILWRGSCLWAHLDRWCCHQNLMVNDSAIDWEWQRLCEASDNSDSISWSFHDRDCDDSMAIYHGIAAHLSNFRDYYYYCNSSPANVDCWRYHKSPRDCAIDCRNSSDYSSAISSADVDSMEPTRRDLDWRLDCHWTHFSLHCSDCVSPACCSRNRHRMTSIWCRNQSHNDCPHCYWSPTSHEIWLSRMLTKYRNCAKTSDRRCCCICSMAASKLSYSLFGRNQLAFRDDSLMLNWSIEALLCFQFAPQPSASVSDLANARIIEEIWIRMKN